MGNNIYETPRNRSKWHDGAGDAQAPQGLQEDDRAARLKALKEQFEKGRKKKK